MGKNYRHLNYYDRLLIEKLFLQKKSVKEIVEITGFSKSTIYRERSLYSYERLNQDLTTERRYSADRSQQRYIENRKRSRRSPKILLDEALAKWVTYMLIKQRYSPKSLLLVLKQNSLFFKVNISSVNTIYRAIYQDTLKEFGVDESVLHYKKDRSEKQRPVGKILPFGTPIDYRPDCINSRLEFGHWEGDCVVGCKGSKKALFVLTERKTRAEVIEVIKSQSSDEIRKALNRLEKNFGSAFYKIFKSITVDNGAEFSEPEAMEKALYRKGNRTKVYYCHPYRPEERGTNENQNKLIRVWFPKHSNFDEVVSKKAAKEVEFWINSYPRSIFNGESSLDKLEIECGYLGLIAENYF